MPELPEVQTVVDDIKDPIGGSLIERLLVLPGSQKVSVSPEVVEGRRINKVFRKGKYIVFGLDLGYMVSHLRMTGQWRYSTSPRLREHDRVQLRLALDSGALGFLTLKDVRKFGTLEFVSCLGDHSGVSKLGTDGLQLKDFKTQCKLIGKASRSRKPIKNFILDQTIIAGVGNAYACEALFLAGINPLSPAKSVVSKLPFLFSVLVDLFQESMRLKGLSISDFEGGSFQNRLSIYKRLGKPCYNCSGSVSKMTLSGRSTFYCPVCQK